MNFGFNIILTLGLDRKENPLFNESKNKQQIFLEYIVIRLQNYCYISFLNIQ